MPRYVVQTRGFLDFDVDADSHADAIARVRAIGERSESAEPAAIPADFPGVTLRYIDIDDDEPYCELLEGFGVEEEN